MAGNGNGAAAIQSIEQRLKATHGGVAEQVPPGRSARWRYLRYCCGIASGPVSLIRPCR